MIAKLSSQQSDFDEKLAALLAWEGVSNKEVVSTVDKIISSIRVDGDKALINYSIQFDGVNATSMNDLTISQSELKKAFDTVNFDIFLNKLNNYGIKNTENNWFKKYNVTWTKK